MRLLTLLASFSTIALAQVDLSQLPACSVTCFENAVAASGCGITDFVCQCTTGRPALTASVTPCIQSSCDASDQQKAAAAAVTICNQALSSTSSGAASATGTTTTGATKTNAASNMKVDVAMGAGIVAAMLL